MAKRNRYFLKIYKGKALKETCQLMKDAFERFHTALMELAKEDQDLSFSFVFDGVDRCIHMDRDVADKAFKCINKPSEQQQPTADAVNHPSHYTSDPSGVHRHHKAP